MKHTKFFYYIFAFVFAISSLTYAQTNYKDLSQKVQPDPSIKIGKMANGLTYYIKKNAKPEKRAELMIVINAGAVLENENQNGLAHFTEHMCFNGTKNFPKNDLISFLESTGVRFGADLNAFTSWDQTVYMLTLPTDKEDLLNKGLLVLEDWASNVAFDPAELEKERGVITEEWRLGKGAEDRVNKKHYPVVFYNSKYATHDVIGDTSVLFHFTRETIYSFYKDWYRPDLMAVIAVGDFEIPDMEKKIKSHFEKLQNPKNERVREKFTIPHHSETFVSIATDKELTAPLVEIYFKHPDRPQGTLENYRSNIIDQLFATMLNNRFQEFSRKPDCPYIFAMGQESQFVGDNIRSLMFVAYSKGDKLKESTESVFTEAFRVMQNGFTQTELDRTKQELLRNMEKAQKEKDKTESKNYAFEFMRNFLNNESIPGIDKEVEFYKAWMPEIKLEEVNKLTKLITKENAVITISAPEKEDVKVPTKDEVLAMFNTVSQKKLEQYKDAVSDKPLFSKKPISGTIASEKSYKDLGVTEWTLSNGVRVVLKPTDYKNDEILFNSYSMGGSSLVPDEDYYSAIFADNIINEAGISQFDATQLQKMLSGKIVSVSPQISDLSQGFNGKCSPEDMETMFQLINLYITEPRKDKESFDAFISGMKSQIKESKNSPRAVFRDTVNSVISNYHYRGLPLTEEKVEKVDMNKAIKIYKERFMDASGSTYFFVGNFTLDKIKPMILKYIGSLPKLDKNEKFKDVGMTSPKGKIKKEVYKGIEAQSTVRMVMSSDFQFTQKNRFEINALMEVFDIVLRDTIREDKGGTYGIGAWQDLKHYPKDECKINITWGCNPERVQELSNSVISLINMMRNKPVDKSYIKKVKEILKREREVNMKENNYWLGTLYSYYYNQEDPNTISNYDKFIDTIDAKMVQNAAKKYFNTDNFIQFVLLPESKK